MRFIGESERTKEQLPRLLQVWRAMLLFRVEKMGVFERGKYVSIENMVMEWATTKLAVRT